MNLPDSYFLQPYKNKDIVLQLKAWAALIFDFSLIFVISIMGIYFVARGTTDPASYILLPLSLSRQLFHYSFYEQDIFS